MFWKVSKNLNLTQGFEHVKGYSGIRRGPRVAANMLKHLAIMTVKRSPSNYVPGSFLTIGDIGVSHTDRLSELDAFKLL